MHRTSAYVMILVAMQGNCEGPPTEENAKQMNLPDSAVADLQAVRPGQCLILLDKSMFETRSFNKWFDNLHIAFVSDQTSNDPVTAIAASKPVVTPGPGSNVFITRSTFHSMGGVGSAQAFIIDPYVGQRRAVGATPLVMHNTEHAVLFHGAKFFST